MSEIKELFAYIDQSKIKLEVLTKSVIYGLGPASEAIMIDEDGEVVRYLNLIDDPLIDGQEIEFRYGKVDFGGNMYLLKYGTAPGKIIKVDASGNVIWAFDEPRIPGATVNSGPVIDGEGNVVYYCDDPDVNNSVHIKKRSPSGEVLWTFPEDPFNSPPEFETPHSNGAGDLAIDVEGNIVYSPKGSVSVATAESKLIKVDKNGNLLWANYHRGLNADDSLEIDREGYIYTQKWGEFKTVEKLNPQGEYIWVYTYLREVLSASPRTLRIDYEGNIYVGTAEVDAIEKPVVLKISNDPPTTTEHKILDERIGLPLRSSSYEYYVKFPPIDDTEDVRVYYYDEDGVRKEAPTSDYSVDYLTGKIAFVDRVFDLYPDRDRHAPIEAEYTSIPGRVEVTQAEWEWTGFRETTSFLKRIEIMAVTDINDIYVGSWLSESNQPSILKIDTSSAPTDGSRFSDTEWEYSVTEDEGVEFNDEQNIIRIFCRWPHHKWIREDSVGGS